MDSHETTLANTTTAVPRRERSLRTVRVLWLINIVALVGLAVWIFVDGKFPIAADMLRARAYAVFERGIGASAYTWYAGRVLTLAIGGICAGVSLLGIFLGLFLGAHPHRRLRSWFAFTLLVAAWLTLFATWHELAWRGQSFRLQNSIASFETIAQRLRSDWPNVDGNLPNTGQFMAYPIGNPTMLMMLTTPEVPHTSTSFSSVERGADGALRFELNGDGPGGWLEWHPPGSLPRSFAGGLESDYELTRYTPLDDGWYLVNYKPGLKLSLPYEILPLRLLVPSP